MLFYVTANENQPSSYRFTQVNQRNLWTLLDWTSQNPLKIMFSSENNQDVVIYQFFIKYYHQSSKSYITALSFAHKVTKLTPQSELNLSVSQVYLSPTDLCIP